MADTSIRQDFVDGVQEIFTTLFNDGSEGTDGVYLYLLGSDRTTNVYKEKKYKVYKPPVLLVCKAVLAPTFGQNDTIEEIKDKAEFTVTLKSLQDNGLSVTHEAIDDMRKGVMKFNDTFYIIDNIIPKAYVEHVFLMYRFLCTEDKHTTEVIIEEPEEVTENG
jgi:hypothetical protein